MSDKIDFSVLIPVYNTKPDELLEAVFSVINQKINQHYKIVIVDDGSDCMDTIGVLEYLKKAGKRGFCEVVVHTLEHNQGTSKALNYGHSIISSEYVAIMGSDDISHPERFAMQTQFLRGRNIDVLGTQLFSFYRDDMTRKPLFTSSHPLHPTLTNTKDGWMVNHGTVFYKNETVKRFNYNPEIGRAQDIDLWKRMGKDPNVKFVNLQQTLYAWRRTRK